MIKSHHNSVKELWIHENEPQASESTRNFDNVITWRQLAFYHDKGLEKKDQWTPFYFSKRN